MASSNIARLLNSHADGGKDDGVSGLMLGRDSSALIGFWGTTPVDKPAAIADLTDSSGGTATGTINAVGATNGTTDRASEINDQLAELATKVNAILNALQETGLITA